MANALLLLAVSSAWALGYLFMGAAAAEAPPITATALMTWIAALVMLPAVGLGLRRDLGQPLRLRAWVPMVMGLTALAVPNLATVVGERTVHPDLASVLGTTVPIATLLLATFVTRTETLSWIRLAGAGVAVVGLIVFVGVGDVASSGSELPGMLVQMAGGLVFAVNGLFVARQTTDLDDCALATWTMVFGAIALTAAAFVIEDPLAVDYDARLIGSLFGEGVVGMGFAYLGYYVLVARAGATFAASYAFLVPPLGLAAAVALDGEPLTRDHVLGVVIVLVGLTLLTRRSPASDQGA